ncbi:MAG: response regulator [Planctomycetota bacterium]
MEATPAPASVDVLLIDNDPDVSELLRMFLHQSGLSVEVLRSGEEGLAFLASGRGAGLVLLDLRMPGMGGLAFLEACLERWGTQELPPVVVVSGFLTDADRERLAGTSLVRAVFQKPFDLLELGRAVQDLLSGAAGKGT